MDVNWWVQHSLPPVTTSYSYYISRQTHRHLIKFGLKMPSTLLSFGCCAVVKQVDLQQQLRHCWKSWHRTTRTQTSPCNVYYAVHDNLARTVLLVVLGWQLQPCIGSSSSMDHGQRFLATRWRFLASCFDNFRLQKHAGLKLWGWHQRGKTSELSPTYYIFLMNPWSLRPASAEQLNAVWKVRPWTQTSQETLKCAEGLDSQYGHKMWTLHSTSLAQCSGTRGESSLCYSCAKAESSWLLVSL